MDGLRCITCFFWGRHFLTSAFLHRRMKGRVTCGAPQERAGRGMDGLGALPERQGSRAGLPGVHDRRDQGEGWEQAPGL